MRFFTSVGVFLMIAAGPAHADQADMSESIEAAGQEFLLRAGEYADYQIAATDRFVGETLAWSAEDGAERALVIGDDGLVQSYRVGDDTRAVRAELFELAPEVLYVSFAIDDGLQARTITADLASGRLIEIASRRGGPEDGTHRAQVAVVHGMLDGHDSADAAPFAVTGDMAGVRLIAHYADDIAYEHIYLNPHRVTWHGVEGPEADSADTEWYDAYKIREHVYLVSWSEKVLTTHMLFLFDFDQHTEIGTIFGYEPETDTAVFETIGARTEVMSGPGE